MTDTTTPAAAPPEVLYAVSEQIAVITLNAPARMNTISREMLGDLTQRLLQANADKDVRCVILTGTGRAFCAGEDMKESLAEKNPGGRPAPMEDPFNAGTLEKPVIAAVNGFAMGGGFMMVERTDLRVAASTAIFEVSEAKRWLLGGYNHGHMANLAFPLAMEMALGFRFTAQRFYEIGFLNRLVDAEQLIPESLKMAEHLLTRGTAAPA